MTFFFYSAVYMIMMLDNDETVSHSSIIMIIIQCYTDEFPNKQVFYIYVDGMEESHSK